MASKYVTRRTPTAVAATAAGCNGHRARGHGLAAVRSFPPAGRDDLSD